MRRLLYLSLLSFIATLLSCKKVNSSTSPDSTTSTTINSANIIGLVQKSSFNSAGKPTYTLTVSGTNFNKNFKDQKVLFNDITVNGSAGDSLHFDVAIPDAVVTTGCTLIIVANGKSKVYNQQFKVDNIQPTVTKVSSEYLMRGTTLMITGTNLSPDISENAVTLNGVNIKVDSISSRMQSNYTGGALPFGDTYISVQKDFYAGVALYVTLPQGATSGKLLVNSYGNVVAYPFDIQILKSSFTVLNVPITSLRSISLDAAGNIYGIANYNKIVKVTPGGVSTTLATIGNPDFILGDCVADAAGNVYVASGDDFSATWGKTSQLYKYTTNSSKIFKVTPAGTVSLFAGSDQGLVDGQGTAAKFRAPKHIARNSKTGDIYVTDAFVIRKISSTGMVSTLAGSNDLTNPSLSSGFKDGQGTSAGFYNLYALAVDSDTGDIYVIDSKYNNELRKVTASGLVSTIPYTLTDPPGSRFVTTMPSSNTTGAFVDVNHTLFLSTENGDLIVVKNGAVSNSHFVPNAIGINGFTINSIGQLYLFGAQSLYIVTP